MFSNKKSKIKKGYSLIYSIIVGLLCVISSVEGISLFLSMQQNVYYLNNEALSLDKENRDRQMLLTKINYDIKNEHISIDDISVKEFLKTEMISLDSDGILSEAYYDSLKNALVLSLCIDSRTFKKEYYSVKVIDDRINYDYLFSVVSEGR